MNTIKFLNDILPLKNVLYRLALRITLNKAEAEDVVQVQVQATLLALKDLAGLTIYGCIIAAVVVVAVPWPKRRLKPEELGGADEALQRC